MYAFCLMENHAHILLSPREENLYDAMRDLFSRYAMRFNKKYERKGHLFGGPYRQAVCLDDSYASCCSIANSEMDSMNCSTLGIHGSTVSLSKSTKST